MWLNHAQSAKRLHCLSVWAHGMTTLKSSVSLRSRRPWVLSFFFGTCHSHTCQDLQSARLKCPAFFLFPWLFPPSAMQVWNLRMDQSDLIPVPSTEWKKGWLLQCFGAARWEEHMWRVLLVCFAAWDAIYALNANISRSPRASANDSACQLSWAASQCGIAHTSDHQHDQASCRKRSAPENRLNRSNRLSVVAGQAIELRKVCN